MNRVSPQENWPASWRDSYYYDQMEIYGELTLYGYAYAYKNRFKRTLEMIRQVAPAGSKVLDVAAAQGNFSLTLAEQGYDVAWNDLREELIRYVELKHSHGKIQFQPGNIFQLPRNQLYDLVLIAEVIEHVAHPDEFLKQIASLTKPGGFIVMTTPNGEYCRNHLPRFSDCQDPSAFESIQFQPNSEGHLFLLHLDEIERLAQMAGLTIVDLQFFTMPFTSGHMKTECLLKSLPRASVEWLEEKCQILPIALKRRLCVQIGAIFRRGEQAI